MDDDFLTAVNVGNRQYEASVTRTYNGFNAGCPQIANELGRLEQGALFWAGHNTEVWVALTARLMKLMAENIGKTMIVTNERGMTISGKCSSIMYHDGSFGYVLVPKIESTDDWFDYRVNMPYWQLTVGPTQDGRFAAERVELKGVNGLSWRRRDELSRLIDSYKWLASEVKDHAEFITNFFSADWSDE